jgi:hypothetical protein
MYLEVRDILKETEIALKETKKIQQKAYFGIVKSNERDS